MDHARIKDLLPLKALDQLDGEEARVVDTHLAAGCDQCGPELASLVEALAAMALVEAGEGSSDRIWNRLEQRLGSEPTSTPPRLSDRPAPRRESGRRRTFTILGSAAAAAIVAIIVSTSFINSHLNRLNSDTSNDIAALTARLVTLQRDLDTTGDRLAALQSKVAQTTDLTLAGLGPDSLVVPLAALTPAPGAGGMVAMNTSQGSAILQVSGLPPAPDDKIYEAWWIGAKQGPLKAGLFQPLSQGSTIVSLNLPPAGEVILAGAITLEPLGGVDKPTGAMYLKGDFPRH